MKWSIHILDFFYNVSTSRPIATERLLNFQFVSVNLKAFLYNTYWFSCLIPFIKSYEP